jgi:hypothetical protein
MVSVAGGEALADGGLISAVANEPGAAASTATTSAADAQAQRR